MPYVPELHFMTTCTLENTFKSLKNLHAQPIISISKNLGYKMSIVKEYIVLISLLRSHCLSYLRLF